jgi:hypothetical protein
LIRFNIFRFQSFDASLCPCWSCPPTAALRRVQSCSAATFCNFSATQKHHLPQTSCKYTKTTCSGFINTSALLAAKCSRARQHAQLSRHVTDCRRVCFNSREAQNVVLDQLQAIILQVLLPHFGVVCRALTLSRGSECRPSSASTRPPALRNDLIQLIRHVFSVHAVRLVNAGVRRHVAHSCSYELKSQAREVAGKAAVGAQSEMKGRAHELGQCRHLPTK